MSGLLSNALMKAYGSTSSWRTHLSLLSEDLPWSSVTLPRWGMMLDGVLWGQMMSAFPTIENASGWWATPAARDWKDTPGMSRTREEGKHRLDQLARQVYASLDGSGSFTAPTATQTETALCAETITRLAGVRGQPWMNVSMPSGAESSGQGRSCDLLNPTWVEWLMGWPVGWTDLKPLETVRFQQWQQQHLEY
jgi:hypothetical protein